MYEGPTSNTAPLNDALPNNNSEIKQERRYRRHVYLAFLGLSLCILGILGLCIAASFVDLSTRTVPASLSPGSSYSISEETISNLTITYYYPALLKVGVPARFDVFISSSELSPTPTVPNQKLLSSTPIPNGTPNVPLEKAFGPGYMVFAYAQMDISPASKFDLPQLRQDSQSLDQQEPTFSWIITPKEPIQVDITLKIIGQWKPIKAGNELDIPLSNRNLSYSVTSAQITNSTSMTSTGSVIQTFSTVGSTLVSFISVLGGLGFTVPWVLDQVRKKKNQPKQEEKPEEKKRV